MDQTVINIIFVGLSFALYFGIAIWARAGSTSEFYAAGRGVNPIVNGMATAADWMSAASFISMAGLIAFVGYNNSLFLMGWTGGYVLMAMLLAPYLRKFGKYTVPEFVGDRYYSQTARIVAVVCLIIISVTYVIGQMTGAGVAFSRFLEVESTTGLIIASCVVAVYAVLGGMKGITYTQVAQYIVLIIAYTIPAIFISLQLTGNPIPGLGLFSNMAADGEAIRGGLEAGVPSVDDTGRSADRSGLQRVHGHDEPVADGALHPVADDRYGRLAARHHPLLHGAESGRCPLVRWLGVGLHRTAVPHRSCCGCDGAHEHHHDNLAGRAAPAKRFWSMTFPIGSRPGP
jgi:Na+(H+)/acetate symporter ActP